ncbi:MAG: DUF1549 and DUF1553 domain-containing protein, partial [Planctomycetales bacterium]
EDVPYDRFVKLQLAADLMEPSDEKHIAALGFIGLGPKYYSRGSLEVMADEWEDRVDVVTRGLLGLTAGCARCHDHKYDPIETEDYYALAGVFASTEMFNRPLDKKQAEKGAKAKKPADALHVVRDSKPRDLNVFIRGDVKMKGPIVKRRFLRVLSPEDPQPFTQGSGRLELAEAIVARDNPLTARVLVNRVWKLNFGRGLVGTPSNFGALGDRPTHPELLDDLAARFMDSGWSLKKLQREMILSATYRQGSRNDSSLAADPANRLLGRMNRRRLSVEAWRDAILSAAGRLKQEVGGKPIDPSDPKEQRRTVYSRVSRLDLNPMLALFDFPDPNAHSARRSLTTTPLQKLFVMNHPFMVQNADALAKRLAQESGDDPAARIRQAYLLLFGRAPTDQETQLATSFLSSETEDQDALWSQYAQVLLASNEFLMID